MTLWNHHAPRAGANPAVRMQPPPEGWVDCAHCKRRVQNRGLKRHQSTDVCRMNQRIEKQRQTLRADGWVSLHGLITLHPEILEKSDRSEYRERSNFLSDLGLLRTERTATYALNLSVAYRQCWALDWILFLAQGYRLEANEAFFVQAHEVNADPKQQLTLSVLFHLNSIEVV